MTASRADPRSATGAIVALALVALACADGGYEPLAVGSVAVLVALLLLAGGLSGRLGRAPVPRSLVIAASCLGGLLVLTALSLDWSGSDAAGFVDAVRLAGYLGVFALAGLAVGRGSAAPVLAGIAVAGVAVAAIALGSRLLGLGAGDAELAVELQTASGRLSFPIGYWNALGAAMAMAIPALAWFATESRSGTWRGVAVSCFAPLLLVAYMTASRGALIAALLGLAVAIGFGADGRRSAATVLVAIIGSLPAMVAVGTASDILETPGVNAPQAGELTVLAVLISSMALTAALAGRVVARLVRISLPKLPVRPRTLIAAGLALLVVVVAVNGPSAVVGDFRSTPDTGSPRTERTAGIISTSGSGRAQFWAAALDAFDDAPIQGLGAGSYEYFWNQNGSLPNTVRNAHSEPLELLAELGLPGFAAFVAFVIMIVVAGSRRARGPGGSLAGAYLGLFVAGLVGVTIDWTWQVPAVAVQMMIAAGLLAGTAFTARKAARRGKVARASGRGGPLLGLACAAFALVALWGGGVLAVASHELDESADALARGQLGEAAAAARTAAAVQPWSSEPWLRLAQIELAGDNYRAALRDVKVSIRKSPDDPRAWALLTTLATELGDGESAFAYAVRTSALIPD